MLYEKAIGWVTWRRFPVSSNARGRKWLSKNGRGFVSVGGDVYAVHVEAGRLRFTVEARQEAARQAGTRRLLRGRPGRRTR